VGFVKCVYLNLVFVKCVYLNLVFVKCVYLNLKFILDKMEERKALSVELNALADKYKKVELDYSSILDPNKWTIMRVDGHKFSTYTKYAKGATDLGIIDSMLHASKKWLQFFNGTCCYTFSDECTLVLKPGNLPFSGKSSKLISLSASMFAVEFNEHFEHPEQLPAYFDCRVFQVDTKEQVIEVIRWRQLDAFRNGVTMYNRSFDQMYKSTKDKINNIVEQKIEVNWKIIHGTFIKKEIKDYSSYRRNVIKEFVLSDKFIIVSPETDWLLRI